MTCPNCGGNLIGDGYTVVLHCERIDAPAGVEPDASPVFCVRCTDYRPDHNGECLNCDEWADAHTPVALLLGEIRHQYERRQRDYAEAGGDPTTMLGDLTCYLPYDVLRPVFPRQRVVTKVGTPDPGPSDPETA